MSAPSGPWRVVGDGEDRLPDVGELLAIAIDEATEAHFEYDAGGLSDPDRVVRRIGNAISALGQAVETFNAECGR